MIFVQHFIFSVILFPTVKFNDKQILCLKIININSSQS